MFKKTVFQIAKNLTLQTFRTALLVIMAFNMSVGSPLLASAAFAAADIKPDENCSEQIAHLSEEFLRQNRIGFIDPSCADPTCSATSSLPGANNAEKIWNFFISQGLQPHQVAGIMGNMQAEAHFEPRLVEYGWPNSRGEISRPGQPSSLDDTVPPDQNEKGQPGYGIIQWTSPGRKQGLRDKAATTGTPASDLGLQLEYVMDELKGPSYAGVFGDLLVSTTVEEATNIILTRYEIPGNIAEQRPIRTQFARDFLAQYGSGTPVAGDPASSSTCGASGSAAIVGQYAFPLLGSKSVVENPGMFRNDTADLGGHPYTAYDIVAAPGTPVGAFLEGSVIGVGKDKCGGRLLNIYSQASNLTVSYLHLDLANHVAEGTIVIAGQQIAEVGSDDNGCGLAHLHIDVAKGRGRPGCRRESCSATNRAKFVTIGPELFQTFQAMPD